MNIERLMQRIRLGEDSTLEMKQVMIRGAGKVIEPHRDGLSDELAALGNASGGTLILGVDDRTRNITGIPMEYLDQVEAWLTAICTDRIKPSLDLVTRHLELPDAEGQLRPVIVAEVPRSLWVHQSANGYFRRVGHAKRELAPDALARLFQQRSQVRMIRFEEQEVPECRFDDLDALLLRRFLKPEQGDPVEQLSRLHLLREVSGKAAPSVVGVLLCSLDPSRWLRNAEIIAVAHDGLQNDPDDQTDAREIKGPLDRQILDAFHFVQRNMITAARKPLGRIDYPQYQLDVVFEAIVNAVAHRDYSIYGSKIRLRMFEDRLELFSPGGIPNTMTVDSLPYRQSARNETISSLLAKRPVPTDIPWLNTDRKTMMDKRGEGVRIILDNSQRLSGKLPEYLLIDGSELVLTIYAAEVS